MQSEKLTRKEIIDHRLKQAEWEVSDRSQVVEEYDILLSAVEDPATHYTGRLAATAKQTKSYKELVSIPVWYDWQAGKVVYPHLRAGGFNSSLVRLAALLLYDDCRFLNSFNSSLVRLADSARSATSKGIARFNSSLVRLAVSKPD